MTEPKPTPASRVIALAARAWENFSLDGRFLRAPFLTRAQRVRFLGAKYVAILAGRTTITWFGRPLAYDNRWTPALMQGYPHEIATVLRTAGLRGEVSVLDVGGNVGQFAATVRGALPGSRIWSFEPNPTALALLEANAAGDDRWTIQGYGISDEDATLDFYFVPGKSSQGSVHEANATLGLLGDAEARHVQVPVQRLTPERLTAAGAPTRFDFVKVDVEGAEREALRGISQIEWGHLLIELSRQREGTLTTDDLLSECETLWGHRMEIAAVLTDNEIAQEVILRNPAYAASGLAD